MTDKLRQAAQQALGALITASGHVNNEVFTQVMMARDAINEALAEPAEAQEPVAWRLRNTAFRSEVYEYFKTRYLAECRQKQFNASVDDGGLHDLTPLYTHPAPQQAAPAEGDALTQEEAKLLEKVISDFEECGETDVPDSALRRFAALGHLECVHYHVMPSAQDAIDAAMAAQKEAGNADR